VVAGRQERQVEEVQAGSGAVSSQQQVKGGRWRCLRSISLVYSAGVFEIEVPRQAVVCFVRCSRCSSLPVR